MPETPDFSEQQKNLLEQLSRVKVEFKDFGEIMTNLSDVGGKQSSTIKSLKNDMNLLTAVLSEVRIRTKLLKSQGKDVADLYSIQIKLTNELANSLKKLVPSSRAEIDSIKTRIDTFDDLINKEKENIKVIQERGENLEELKFHEETLTDYLVAQDKLKSELIRKETSRIKEEYASRGGLHRKWMLISQEMTEKVFSGFQTVFGTTTAEALQPLIKTVGGMAVPFLALNQVLKTLWGSLGRTVEFMGTMQQFGGVAGRASEMGMLRARVMGASMLTMLSAEESQKLYTTAVEEHLYALADANELYDEHGNMQRMTIATTRELVEQTANVTFAVQRLGKTIGLTNEQSISVASQLYNRFNVELNKSARYMNLAASMARQMQVSFMEFFEPLSNVASDLAFMDVSFDQILGNSAIMMRAMDDLSRAGERFWADITPEQKLRIFTEGVQKLHNITAEMVMAWKGGLAPGETLGEAYVSAFEMGPIQKGILGVEKAFELGFQRFGKTAEEQAAVIQQMIGLEGREGMRITQTLMKAAERFSPEQIVKMTQPELLDELQRLTGMTEAERMELGSVMNAASKEPLELIKDILQKMLEQVSTIASSPLLRLGFGRARSLVGTPSSTPTGVARIRGLEAIK